MRGSPVIRPGYGRGRHPGNFGLTYPPDAVTPEEVRMLLETNAARRGRTKIRDRALILTLYRAGLRVSEALALQPKDVDMVNRNINVMKGKGGKRRTVGTDPDAITAIRAWLDVRNQPASAPLFCTLHGTRLYPSHVRGVLHKLARDAGIVRRVHPHGFRHAFAVELAREGVPVPMIQRLLGHSNLATTDRYLQTLMPTEALRYVHDRKSLWEAEDSKETDD